MVRIPAPSSGQGTSFSLPKVRNFTLPVPSVQLVIAGVAFIEEVLAMKVLILTLAALTLGALPSYSAEPDQVRQLLRTNKCTNCDLREADLRRLDLKNADLSGSDLTRANLSGADLSGANLADTDLRGVNFRNANLRYANLRGADVRGADFTGAILTGTELEDAIRTNGFIDIPGRATLRQLPPPVRPIRRFPLPR
jgi:uncharacterized protein YjbI with pentapeptide repeats